ncbi:hypothetical protein F2P79_005414 [Pimephales promelas]|nr:hypothetical protein F2P79_005414 [Pimephales promelas]
MRKLEREVVVLQGEKLSPRGLQCTFLLLVIPDVSITLPSSQWAYMTFVIVFMGKLYLLKSEYLAGLP